MVVSARERSNLPQQIKSILDGYPLGGAILREFLQNSDDAKATKQIFILDPRDHPKEHVADPALKECQGPALLAVNDTLFSESDWEALGTIHGSNKATDETKTGKYGLGFRACYHLTDNPHVLSGDRLRIFDPHEDFQGLLAGGLYINTVTEAVAYADHITAFQAAEATPQEAYNGTAIRLPLRTQDQAEKSQIRSTAFSVDDIRSLFTNFVNGELGITLLFLKHIRSVELREIELSGTVKVIGRMEISGAEGSLRSDLSAGQRSFQCQTIFQGLDGQPQTRDWRIIHHLIGRNEACEILLPRLEYSLDELNDALRKEKLIPHVGLAMPLDSSGIDCPLFTLLPLPIRPGLPLCVHSTFALTPDRQHLKNDDDKASKRHHEGLLVQWNRMIFDKLIPEAWAELLQLLIKEDHHPTFMKAWPPFLTGASTYSSAILPNLLKIIINQGLRVFPVLSDDHSQTPSSYVSFQDALFYSPNLEATPIGLLIRVGLFIVEFPVEQLPILRVQAGYKTLSPNTASEALRSRSKSISKRSDDEKNTLLEYLLSDTSDPTRLKTLIGLPLLPLVNGLGNDRATITQSRTLGPKPFIIPVTVTEETLFSRFEPRMVALSALPTSVHSIFVNCTGDVSLRIRSAHDVLSYLKQAVRAWKSVGDQVGDVHRKDIDWLVQFWNDVDLPMDMNIKEFQKLQLIPTDTNSVRRVQAKVLSLRDVDEGAAQALRKLGVHFLHGSISPSDPRLAGYCRKDVPFLIDLVDTDKLKTLGSEDWDAISKYLTQLLNSTQPINLQPSQLQTFKTLKIFPTWTGGTQARLDSIIGEVHFISELSQVPAPVLRSSRTFVLSAHNPTLSQVLAPNAGVEADAEPALLQLAIDNWTEQPPDSRQLYVDRIIARFSDLPLSHQSKFTSFPFVSVGSECLRPSEVIDPSSSLHKLYLNEGLTPTGAFGVGTVKLRFLQAHGLLAACLTRNRVAERIEYIVKLGPTMGSALRANVLLQLLDQSWDSSFTDVIKDNREAPWLPCSSGSKLLTSPNRCRDTATSPCLFDLSLDTSPFQLKSAELRTALGWDTELPTRIILLQLEKLPRLRKDKQKVERLEVIIQELSDRFGRGILSPKEFERLRTLGEDRKWIPSHSGELLDVEHAMLTTEFLGSGFQQVHPSLLACHDFLRKIGCEDRPTLEALLDEYQTYTSKRLSSDDSRWIIQVLKELSQHDCGTFTTNLMLPDRDGVWRPYEQTYYDDFQNRATSSHDTIVHPVHPLVLSTLAEKLKIPFLSALNLDEDEGEDEEADSEGMVEWLVDRIKNFLKDHDIKHAFNDFAAHASDAGAAEFSILLDERQNFPSGSIISPELKRFQQGLAVILYSDASFTKEDFESIRDIGRRGNRDQSAAIGKFGLGAFSVFHFTDLPMIVSNKHIMILDPSGKYLPPKRGNKRTVLFRQLSTFSSQYPDQLEPFRGLFNIPLAGPINEFQGTLFRLPLPVGIPCTLPTDRSPSVWYGLLQDYQDLGRNGFFFTRMVRLELGHLFLQSEEIKNEYWWRGHAKRAVTRRAGHTIMDLELSLDLSGDRATSEHWIITTSAYPTSCAPVQFQPILDDLNICQPDDPIIIQTAFPLFPFPDKFYLFSRLRLLPQAINLPFHLQALFAIPSGCTHIHFDSGDDTLPTEYNTWLLDELVPTHYLSSLEILQPVVTDNFWEYWPDVSSDDDTPSCRVSENFYKRLPTSSSTILRSLSGKWLAPVHAKYLLESPDSIRTVLRDLEVDDIVTPHERIRHAFANYPLVITPELLVQVLRPYGDKIQSTFKSGTLLPVHIDDTLVYLLTEKADTSDLPLLMMVDQTLRSPNPPELIYHIPHPHENLIKWISPSRVLDSRSHTRSTELLLTGPNSGIKEFSNEDISALLGERLQVSPSTTHSPEITQWIQDFWAVLQFFPEQPTSNQLADFPIIPTHQERHHVSLRACRNGTVLPFHSFPEDIIHDVLSAFNISMVRSKLHPNIQAFLHREQFSVVSLLKRLDDTTKTNPGICEDPRFGRLAKWIRESLKLTTISDRAVLDIIRRLPIWEACLHSRVSLHPLDNISLLPLGISHNDETIKRYTLCLLSNQDQIVQYSNKDPLTAEELLNLLNLPNHIPSNHLRPYADFIKCLGTLSSTNASALRVPDGHYTMRPVHELYDTRVPLFAGIFRDSQDETKFIHPMIRNQLQPSVSSYLQNKVNTETVLALAQELHGDLDNLSDAESQHRARLIYEAFTSYLPSQVMTKTTTWARFDDLRFIPREDSRCRHASYDVNAYFEHDQLPDVVSPSQIVSRQYERIAWTQRGLLLEVVDLGELLSVYPQFGVPGPLDVVEHLRFLSHRIAPAHLHDRSLIEDLKATYQWLGDNQHEAREVLSYHKHIPLFLNVDDPHSDDWRWCSAQELMLGVTWDSTANGTRYVREFLKQYEAALRGAGVNETHRAEYPSENPSDAPDSLQDVYNKMRLAAQTDAYLVPTKIDKSEDTYTQRLASLRCHTSFLTASCLRYARGAPINWIKVGDNFYSFPGTFIGAYTFLEFIYADAIAIPEELDINDETLRNDLLNELLSLLQLADQWGMNSFKEAIGRAIVGTFRLLELHTYKLVKDHAERYHAAGLVSACEDFEQKNAPATH